MPNQFNPERPRRIRDPGIETALSFSEKSSFRDHPILGHFDLVHTTKREE